MLFSNRRFVVSKTNSQITDIQRFNIRDGSNLLFNRIKNIYTTTTIRMLRKYNFFFRFLAKRINSRYFSTTKISNSFFSDTNGVKINARIYNISRFGMVEVCRVVGVVREKSPYYSGRGPVHTIEYNTYLSTWTLFEPNGLAFGMARALFLTDRQSRAVIVPATRPGHCHCRRCTMGYTCPPVS